MGTWTYSYDAVDRLVSGAQTASTATSPQYAGMHGCWSYDSYGNRTMEAFSTAACSNNPVPQVVNTYNASNNQISTSTLSSATLTPGSFGYDASGNTLFDGNNRYWYDAEGQLCAVQNLRWQGGAIIQYIYDAEGARIGQGTLASAPSSYTATCAPPFSSGFTLTKRYLVDLGGDQVTELDGAGTWKRSNIWAGGKLVATYDTKGIHFELTDPLGTKRVQANASGQIDEQCTGLPFGNDLNNNPSVSCSAATNSLGTNDDATEHHFTQKERDTETGNDYFLARYYSSALGRFTTPDWSAKDEPVPYAKLDDPQTLNLYAYVRNNPVTHDDPDGHCVGFECQSQQDWIAQHQVSNLDDKQIKDAGLVKIDAKFTPRGGVETLGKTAGVVGAETTSLKKRNDSNMSLFDAQSLLGHERINAERKFGKDLDNMAGMMPGVESGDEYQGALKAVIHSAIEDIQGIDPTHGALWYNMRNLQENMRMGDRKPSWLNNKQGVHTRSGPYDTWHGQKYILTYGAKEGVTQ